MNKIQRKLFLSLFFVLAVLVGIITAVIAYVIRERQLARFGDIFDRVALE